ncbi:TPA: TonB-dependent receptor [Pseudomonas aeruginosa]|uniref:TonB-dependent receptor n=1 Tax=Pseudomonas sp. PNPG3 TaxID=2919497 RepID=UPI001FFC6467|nr:TonB-dependent receptor [Pseudomonas sp. PNPG3]MCK2119880.1 TonB-dependent receptor [Pseudomonas sp. PNPG3]HEP8866697.1 TonB-dependent receptor [Pseudomonas aeruginosa]
MKPGRRLAAAISRACLAGVAGSLMVGSVWAAESSGDSEQRDSTLETVVVTASKRAEKIKDVPIPITAVTGEAIRDKDITTSSDIERLAPNLSGQSSGNTGGRSGKPRWFLRGIGTNDPNANQEGPLAIYVDEVVVGLQGDQNFPLFDLERVEVLRGPQGTLWGKNNTGGAIHFVSRKPTFDTSGYTKLGVGSYGSRLTEAAVGGELVPDKLAGRAAIYYEKGEGWADNIVTDTTGPRFEDFNGRFQLLGNLTDNLDALLILNLRKLNTGNTPNYIVGATSVDNVTTPNPGGGINQGGTTYFPPYGDDPDNKSDFFSTLANGSNNWYGTTLKLNWYLGENTLTSITGLSKGNGDTWLNPQIPPGSTLDRTASDGDTSSDQFTQEIRLSSPTDRPLSWIAGAYYYDLQADSQTDTLRYRSGNTQEQFSITSWDQDAKSWALFGNVKYRFTERAAVTLGLRQTWESKDITETTLTATDTPGNQNIVIIGPGGVNSVTGSGVVAPLELSTDASWTKTTWDITPEYRFTDDILGYIRIATGFRSGGFNQSIVRGEIIETDPETLTDYEVGLKTSWLDGRLTANVSAFYYDIKDLQLNIQQQVPGTTITSTAGSSDGNVKGVELEVEALPLENWRLAASLGLLKSEYTNFVYTVGPTTLDASGNEFYRTPETSFRLDTDYRIRLGDVGQLLIGTDWSYRSHIYHNATVQDDPVQETGSYWNGNARISYFTPDNEVQVTGFVKNLTDQSNKVLSQIVNQRGVYPTGYVAPRTYGVQLTYNF